MNTVLSYKHLDPRAVQQSSTIWKALFCYQNSHVYLEAPPASSTLEINGKKALSTNDINWCFP